MIQSNIFFVAAQEVDLAITADLGTLQRLPHIVGHGKAAELALTACSVSGREAESMGLVSRCFVDRAAATAHAHRIAEILAAKPSLALQGTKRILLHARSHPDVKEGLDYVATWNSAMVLSRDLEALVQQAMVAKLKQQRAKL